MWVGKGDGLGCLSFGFWRQVAGAPVEAQRAQPLLDLQHLKAFTFGDCRLDFGARTIQKVAPSAATGRISSRLLEPGPWRVKEVRVSLDQIDSPIHDARHPDFEQNAN